MKKIIIIGVCLVTAAIVYGLADYLHTDKKQLQHMYGDEPAAATPVTTPSLPTTGEANPEPAAGVAPPARVRDEAIAVDEPIQTDAPDSMEKPANKKPRRKTLNLELYSRAALEEKFIAPNITTALSKTKKTVEDTTFFKVNLSSFSRAPLRRRPVVVDTTAATVVQQH